MNIEHIDLDEVAEITLRWARRMQRFFPNWEVDELRNEAFLISVGLLERGRYKPEKAKLNTFLWHALRLDVRHRYRRCNGERYINDENGVRKYRRVEIVDDTIVENAQQPYDGELKTIEPKNNNSWLSARLAGFTPRELQRRGMSYKEQKKAAEELRSEQQSKRQTR